MQINILKIKVTNTKILPIIIIKILKDCTEFLKKQIYGTHVVNFFKRNNYFESIV